jgi:hypothetical protein
MGRDRDGGTDRSLQTQEDQIMAVATGLVTVNAAFLREIKDDNRRVHELLDQAGGLLAATPREVPPRRVVETLSELRDQLALHFSLEEAYGYFEDAVDVAPRLSERAAELRSQHAVMFVALCQIVDEAERWLYHEAQGEVRRLVVQRFDKFRREFREHESREAELILDAWSSDVGVGD